MSNPAIRDAPWSGLDPDDRALCEAARDAARHGYAPYSGLAVGAAVRTKSGRIFAGANLENAAYGVTICAEVAAITAANSAGEFNIVSLALTGHRVGTGQAVFPVVTPCGRCRQIISEAAIVADTDIRVLCCSNRDLVRIYRISELLPDSFGPDQLGKSPDG
jgi:cytidine deaminase